METTRSKFTGSDQEYLRDVQYRDGSRLARRANLHAKYRTASTPFFDWVGAHFDLFGGAEVLEVGCGTGWLWQESSFDIPPGVKLTLTDLSPGMVKEAVARVEAAGRVETVAGQPADAQSLPFENGSFDRVVANHMLYHLPDPALGVAELARVVRSDGVVIASTNGSEHLRELWEMRAKVFGTSPVDETATVFNPEIGFELLREHFAEVDWFDYPDQLICTDPVDVLAHICSAPPAETATPEQLSHLTDEVERAFNAGGGRLMVTKEVGCFVTRGQRKRPRR
ncbi:MAG: methyltransferase domain-containing protein [Gammaproteobacteria bacterium]|nr:methyltransferase domain-containing protein [Gammaproteobacteria bacterium]